MGKYLLIIFCILSANMQTHASTAPLANRDLKFFSFVSGYMRHLVLPLIAGGLGVALLGGTAECLIEKAIPSGLVSRKCTTSLVSLFALAAGGCCMVAAYSALNGTPEWIGAVSDQASERMSAFFKKNS